MAIPISYNLRSLRVRWVSALVAVLGIAGTVGVFIAMLSLANGFRATLVSSGSPRSVIVRRAGATTEMESVISRESVRIVQDAPGVARGEGGPLTSAEVVVISPFPLMDTGTDANVQVRGVQPEVLNVRANVKMVSGRFFQSGTNELVVGSSATSAYRGLKIGNTVRMGGVNWTVVGVMDAGASAFDSEVWGDANILNAAFQRPINLFQSMTVQLDSPNAFARFKDALTSDPRLAVSVERETEYYEKQSRTLTQLITILGTIVAVVMGIGAVFGALNTMYSAVIERTREIATMRAIGFTTGSVVASFVIESLCVSLVGGLVGCVAVIPLNNLTTGAMNFQTFSYLAFAFRITPQLMGYGILFALFMGLIGGLPPALRAARAPVVVALREL
ncbi:MAG: ABC transporter permease [Acidobacteria bacterium]|nr:ABC transporter permease [Acidobacteriota bacterium]